jgi:predicted nucleic acid-binding protein
MLVDTTVWIDFFRGTNTRQVSVLEESIGRQDELFYCGVILTEILQGISRKKQSQHVKSLFGSLLYLDFSHDIYIQAADIYVKLREKGVTVRKTIDCLIAALAISNELPLLHSDKDFIPIEKYCGLKCL